MVRLTRLNGDEIVLNSDLVRYAEASPDTVITLVTGEKIVVVESCEELTARVVAYRAGLLRAAFPQYSTAAGGAPSLETALGARAASDAVGSVQEKANIQAGTDEDQSWRRRRRDRI